MERLCSDEGKFIMAVFCMDWHSGQWSRGYRLLCRLKPERFSSSLCEELRQTELYHYLEANYSNKI